MKIIKPHLSHTLSKILATLLAILIIGTGIFFGVRLTRQPLVPKHIKSQVDFLIFYPKDKSLTTVDNKTFKIEPKEKVMSFIVYIAGVKTTIIEQPTPDSFTDIPLYYDKVINTMGGYASFDTYAGKVNLTHPTSLNGEQTAVISTKGTLLFLHPEKEIDQSTWRKFFNSLEVLK